MLDFLKGKKKPRFNEKEYPGITEAIKSNSEVIGTITFEEVRKPQKRQRLPRFRKQDPTKDTEEIQIEQEPIKFKVSKATRGGGVEIQPIAEPIADVFEDESQLDRTLKAREEGEFAEPDGAGPRRIELDEVTSRQLLTIMYKPDARTLKTVTVTPPRQFDALVIGETFNRMAKGEHEGEDQPSVWDMIVEERDLRAPSLRGESRHELVQLKSQESSDEGGTGRQGW
jgi:hypothetical protein